jgi:hypothetical protein
MEQEQLKPSQITVDLENRLTQLKQVLAVTQKHLANTPQGHLRVSQKGHNPEFYQITEPGDTRGTYIPRAKLALARRLAQKDYDSRLIKQLKQEIRALQKYLAQTKGGDCCKASGASSGRGISPGSTLTALYTKLCPARQSLVTPITFTDAQYAAQWQAVSWTGLPFSPDSPDYTTARGERVRSNSEVIIAATLARHGIPYRYEYPLELNYRRNGRGGTSRSDLGDTSTHGADTVNSETSYRPGRTVHPDFLCLNVRTRAEFYWEHFGLMDDPDYLERTLGKLKDFAENKILPGKNLLFTMESTACKLSTRQIENLINEFLL